ncbi:MAG: class IV adenylate cyclase [Candidatus Cloacimonetes bacterium]|nr:class IV adenylate cyclase [Candidatus Cloacimonadota bacterium]
MTHLNIEIKAKSENHDKIRKILESKNVEFKVIDHQIDTYFKVGFGRLKLREGNIENHLIHYQRENKKGPKQSNVTLYKSASKSNLKEILSKSIGILIVIDKKREIYFIDNVKFHLDTVKNLGTFVEIEAIDFNGNIGAEKISEQCNFYIDLFQILPENLISVSYSDLALEQEGHNEKNILI